MQELCTQEGGRRTVVRILALAIIALAVSWLPAPLAAGSLPHARHIVLLSLDGARSDAITTVLPPALAGRAAVARAAKTISPSLTLPSHASMLSGVAPWRHGVTFNDWRDGEAYFTRTTVFTEVTGSGGRAAAIVHKRKLLMLSPPGPGLVVQYLAYPRFRQAAVVAHAARYLREQRPAFLFVHVADPDDAGHRYGWMTPEYLAVVAGVPALIEQFLQAFEETGLAEQSLLIVTADHGGHGRTHGTNRAEDMMIPWMVFGAGVRRGTVIDRLVTIYDTGATVLGALGVPVPSDWHGRMIREAFSTTR